MGIMQCAECINMACRRLKRQMQPDEFCSFGNIRLPELDTVEGVKEILLALEKQAPKEPLFEGDGVAPDGSEVYDTWIRPCCESRFEVEFEEHDYCPNCGQRIDWGEMEK